MIKKPQSNRPLSYIMRAANEDVSLLEEIIKNNSTGNVSIGGKRKLKKKTRKLKKKSY